MFASKQEIFGSIILISLFFVLLVTIIVLAAIVYYNRKRVQDMELANFQNILLQTQYEVQEQTMQTIGTDLHDNIGQLLSLTSLTLNSIEVDSTSKARQKIDTAIDLTVRSVKELRLLGKLLQGDQLMAAGLDEAIRHEIRWLERSGRYQIAYVPAEEMPAENNADKNLIMFRIMQEVLNNIIKHAGANRIDINLEYAAGTLQLQIADDGVGFNTANFTNSGMGLHNINKREGTLVKVFIPYP
jgi:two-component system NarL family sensor kinase